MVESAHWDMIMVINAYYCTFTIYNVVPYQYHIFQVLLPYKSIYQYQIDMQSVVYNIMIISYVCIYMHHVHKNFNLILLHYYEVLEY